MATCTKFDLAEKFRQNWQSQYPFLNQPKVDYRMFYPNLLKHNNSKPPSCNNIDLIDDSLTNLNWLQNLNLFNMSPTQIPLSPPPIMPSNYIAPPVSVPVITTSKPAQIPIQQRIISPYFESSSIYAEVAKNLEFMIDEASVQFFKTNSQLSPPFSVISLISMAIYSYCKQKVSFPEICCWIESTFPYYNNCVNDWKNDIKNYLTISKCFQKVPRRKDEAEKGGFWRFSNEFLQYLQKFTHLSQSYSNSNLNSNNSSTGGDENQCLFKSHMGTNKEQIILDKPYRKRQYNQFIDGNMGDYKSFKFPKKEELIDNNSNNNINNSSGNNNNNISPIGSLPSFQFNNGILSFNNINNNHINSKTTDELDISWFANNFTTQNGQTADMSLVMAAMPQLNLSTILSNQQFVAAAVAANNNHNNQSICTINLTSTTPTQSTSSTDASSSANPASAATNNIITASSGGASANTQIAFNNIQQHINNNNNNNNNSSNFIFHQVLEASVQPQYQQFNLNNHTNSPYFQSISPSQITNNHINNQLKFESDISQCNNTSSSSRPHSQTSLCPEEATEEEFLSGKIANHNFLSQGDRCSSIDLLDNTHNDFTINDLSITGVGIKPPEWWNQSLSASQLSISKLNCSLRSLAPFNLFNSSAGAGAGPNIQQLHLQNHSNAGGSSYVSDDYHASSQNHWFGDSSNLEDLDSVFGLN